MTHKCNLCGKPMKAVDNIDLQGFKIHGWKCRCGNVHSDPEDVDTIIKFLKFMKTDREAKMFKSGNSYAIRIPIQIAKLYHLTQRSKLLFSPENKKLVIEIIPA